MQSQISSFSLKKATDFGIIGTGKYRATGKQIGDVR